MRKLLSIIFLFILVSISVYPSTYNIRQISSRDGLSNSAVICLHQDAERYLWIGTYDGLNKYNGTDIDIYKPDIGNKHSLSGNVIRGVIDSKDNYLWIMTKWGLDKYSKKKNEVEAHFSEFAEDCSIACDSKGTIFILTRKGDFFNYDSEKEQFNKIEFPTQQLYNYGGKLLIDDEDKVWISSRGNIKKFSIDSSGKSKSQLTEVDSFEHDELIIYTFYDKGSLIIVDRKGDLFLIKSDQKTYIKNILPLVLDSEGITSIIFDDQDILIASLNNGLVRLDHKKKYAGEKMPINCGVFSLLKDDVQDILWIGTDGQGVYACTKEEYTFNGINFEELPIDKPRPIRAIYADHNNDLWLGTKGNGIIKIKDYDNDLQYNQSNVEHFTKNNGLDNDAVFAFEMSSHNNILWIGSNGPHLNYYSYEDGKIHTLVNREDMRFIDVHSMLESSDSILWVASSGRLLKVNIAKRRNTFEVNSIRKYEFDVVNKQRYNSIFSIRQENDSIMWLGIRGNGVIRLNQNNGNYRLITFDEESIAPMNDILSICLDKSGNNWFGSSYGINSLRYLANGEFDYKNFNEKDGLPNNTIHGILENSDGRLWLSSNAGITLFDSSKGTSKSFNHKTGLKVIEFSDNAYYKDEKTSRYFFGGIDGLIWIKQEEEREGKHFIPPVHFTKLRLFNEEFNINDFLINQKEGNLLQLEYNQNFFAISFIANDFSNGVNGKYSYKLDNFSDVWMDANSCEAQFTNIPPGEYTLRVKYHNADASDSHNASLSIVILPPWYLTIYAKILYGIIICALFFWAYLYLTKKYERKKRKIEHQLDQKYKEEMYEGKLRFFTNITHEFCTPLTLIHIPCERILNYDGSDPYVKKYAWTIKSNTEKLNNLIQEVIDFRRMETGNNPCKVESCNINNICTEIVNSFTDLAEENGINFSLNIVSSIIWNLDQSCITKILNNLISNAFKYTPQNGFISVTVKTEDEQLVIKVYNTGKGIDEKSIPYIFNRYSVLDNVEINSIKGLSSRNGLGLAICKSLVDQLGGDIDVKSEVGKYAEFIVKLPTAALSDSEHHDYDEDTSSDAAATDDRGDSKIAKLIQNKSDKPSILVVDDNTGVRSVLKDILSDEYNVITAKDGHEGLKKMTDMAPELIITDIMMPNYDGISLTKEVKSNPHTMHIPLIILSAKSTINDKISGIESGADAYIPKPFDTEYFKTVIKQLLEKKRNLKEYYNSSASTLGYLNGHLLTKEDREFINLAVDIIEKNIDNFDFSPEDLADNLQISVRSLYRKFKDLELPSPKDFIKELRITLAANLILKTNLTIQEIMYSTGFTTRSHFYKEFTKRYNQSPGEYRENNNKEDV